jgi:hypothetical protein
MLYRPSSFRKSAFALTTIAALAGASILANFPANAQQVVNASPCDAIRDSTAGIKCEIKKLDERNKAAKERAATADEIIGCLKDLGKFKEKNPEGFAKLGTITRDNACSAAAKISRPTASLN